MFNNVFSVPNKVEPRFIVSVRSCILLHFLESYCKFIDRHTTVSSPKVLKVHGGHCKLDVVRLKVWQFDLVTECIDL